MNTFAGTGLLVRLALRRDRLLIPAVSTTFVLVAAFSAAATSGLFPTTESLVAVARSSNASPALVALYGWIYDETSKGGVGLVKMNGYGPALIGLYAALLVIRHTRTEEETGRTELLGATRIGRFAFLTAAMVVAAGAAAATGIVTAAALVAAGLEVQGSVAFGLMWTLVGLAFVAVGAVVAQLTPSARPAKGIVGGVVAGAYLLRGIGDAAGNGGPMWISWLSPVGWGQQIRPFGGNRWVVGLVPLVFATIATAAAYAIAGRRDIGAGVLPDRPGAPRASRALSGPWGLSWRLQRGVLLTWVLAFLVVGTVVGSIADSIGEMLDSEQFRDILAELGGHGSLVDSYLAAELGMLGVLSTVYAVTSALRLRSEEVAQHAEAVLATGVDRTRWALTHMTVSFIGAGVVLLAGGLATGAAYAATIGDAGQVGRVSLAALARLPAVWVVIGVTMAAFGHLPRLSAPLAWASLVTFMVLGEFGTLMNLPGWAIDLSPYAHVPLLPAPSFDAAPLLALTGVAAGLTTFGLVGYRRRDIG